MHLYERELEIVLWRNKKNLYIFLIHLKIQYQIKTKKMSPTTEFIFPILIVVCRRMALFSGEKGFYFHPNTNRNYNLTSNPNWILRFEIKNIPKNICVGIFRRMTTCSSSMSKKYSTDVHFSWFGTFRSRHSEWYLIYKVDFGHNNYFFRYYGSFRMI